MFNLENEISRWKKSLRKSKKLDDGVIDELETHLRDEIDNLIKDGAKEFEALNAAIENIGDTSILSEQLCQSNRSEIDSWENRRINTSLIFSYLKTAYRNFSKNFGYSFLNLSGLTLAITVAIFITLLIKYELSYDQHYKESERIYRVVKEFVFEDERLPDATTPPPLANAIKEEIPGIEYAIKIMPSWGSKFLFSKENNKFYEENVVQVEADFFKIFNNDALLGSLEGALSDPMSMVITESMAKKYFGEENPIGQTLEHIYSSGTDSRIITAVVKDVPVTSHFTYDFLIPFFESDYSSWGWYNFYTYIKVTGLHNISSLNQNIQTLFKKYNPENDNQFYTQPITDIHLHSNLKWEMSKNGNIDHVYIYSTIAILVLIIGSINYINLATARSVKRSKEIGLRKVSGANKVSILRQFLLESSALTLCAFLVSTLIVFLLLPQFNQLFEISIILGYDHLQTFVSLGLGSVILGLVAGFYPAVVLANFNTSDVLKGNNTSVKSKQFFRRILVGLQFVMSASLITGTTIIFLQIDFINNFDYGIDRSQVLVLPNANGLENYEALRSSLKELSGVENVGGSSGVIGGMNSTTGIKRVGAEEDIFMNYQNVDEEFLKVVDMDIIDGRNFIVSNNEEANNSFVISQKSVKELGLREPVIGSKLIISEGYDTTIYANIVGVVNDFNFTSLHEEIKPFFFRYRPDRIRNIHIKIHGSQINKTVIAIGDIWEELVPDRPYNYFFLDEQFNSLHKADLRFGKLFGVMAVIAIFISCMGLFALTAYNVQTRTKEIGIRKILGASVSSVTYMITSEQIKNVIFANIISWVFTYYAMDLWLREFVYRIELSLYMFLVPTLLTISIAIITVFYLSVKAGLSNPVKSLRYE